MMKTLTQFVLPLRRYVEDLHSPIFVYDKENRYLVYQVDRDDVGCYYTEWLGRNRGFIKSFLCVNFIAWFARELFPWLLDNFIFRQKTIKRLMLARMEEKC